MEKKDRKYTLKVNGKKIEVGEEIYRAYIRPVRSEQRQKRREWKCVLLSEKGGHYVRCKKQCESCPYYISGQNARGNKVSLDKLMEAGADYTDENGDMETNYIERETEKEEHTALHEAIKKLTPRQQEMVRMVYFEGKTQEEVAKHYEVDKSAISHAMQRIYASLKKYLQKN